MCVSLLLLTTVVSLAAGIPQQGSGRQSQAAAPSQSFKCPDDGFFEDLDQCDLYWECVGGVASPNLCDDGLVFDVFKARAGHVDPCDTPLVVDCTDRPLMQDPTYPSHFCERRHGLFADPDPKVCNRFHTCKDGHKESSTDCTTGLHFDPVSGTCTWPELAFRQGCVDESTSCIKNGNFCCTGEARFTAEGLKMPHPTYINFEDCQKFYVCLNNEVPQEASCSLGQVFNDKTLVCDYAENVPECAGWYRDHPAFKDYYEDEPVSRSDVGAQDTVAS